MNIIPYYPIHSDPIPHYSIFDVELFGPPDLYGITSFAVIDEQRYDYSQVLTQEDYDRPNKTIRPIHIYNREQRFKSTLRTLLGGSRDPIPIEILTCFTNSEVDWHKDRVWNSIRAILKTRKKIKCEFSFNDECYYKFVPTKKYYNRIPEILRFHYYRYRLVVPPTINYEEIYIDFKKMHHKFDTHEDTLSRREHSTIHRRAMKDCIECSQRAYFPNLRYIILRMLKDRNVEFQYSIPLLRTKRKLPILARVWQDIT